MLNCSNSFAHKGYGYDERYTEFISACKRKFESDLAIVSVEMTKDRLTIIETGMRVSFVERLGMVGKTKTLQHLFGIDFILHS